MYRIAICDDDAAFAEALCSGLRRWATGKSINVEVTSFYEGTDLLENITEYGHYQIVFLDVEMGKINGLSLAAKIAEGNVSTLIIFVSAYDSYFRQAYEAHPFYFFSKPIGIKKLYSVMDDAIAKIEIYKQNIRFRYKMVHYSVFISEILYLFSEGRRIGLICRDGRSYWFYKKLDEVEKQIGTKTGLFIRIHKSYLVNTQYINIYQYEHVVMTNGQRLPISQKRRKNVRKQQGKLLMDV